MSRPTPTETYVSIAAPVGVLMLSTVAGVILALVALTWIVVRWTHS